jgi:hypothetical protein
LARRLGTLDPVLAELRAEVLHRLPMGKVVPQRDLDRRRVPRGRIDHPAILRVGVLGVEGRVLDVGVGGVFFRSDLLVESGERGMLEVAGAEPAKVRVAWIRGPAHPAGPGIGMAFELRDPKDERRALESVLALLDGNEAEDDDAGPELPATD